MPPPLRGLVNISSQENGEGEITNIVSECARQQKSLSYKRVDEGSAKHRGLEEQQRSGNRQFENEKVAVINTTRQPSISALQGVA
mmetsp:Transcript_49477/g.94543  ORF Transcript_49477/g.94543 Transcript_49477/m.94543 type:complete len:85 (+) Transcript_49477:61-315(+)